MEAKSGEQTYRDRFLELMHNRDKRREGGFVVFVYGSVGLVPIQKICQEQSYNQAALTARYRAGPGSVPTPLFAEFRWDASGTRRPDGASPTSQRVKTKRTKASQQAVAPGVGVLVPPITDQRWAPVQRAMKGLRNKLVDAPWPILERLAVELGDDRAGYRVVLMCELDAVREDETLEDIGFTSEVIANLVSLLPQRVGLVFSGVPKGLHLPELGERFLGLEVPSDYEEGRPEERNQPLTPDRATGDDHLLITSDVEALADAIMTTDVEPPLVVGVLGGWGSGKSFVLHLLKKRIREIRLESLPEPSTERKPVYIGHPYIVHFDAWTYAKADLWASLMQRILFDLDQQLSLEQNLLSAGVDLRTTGIDIWDIIETLSTKQLKALDGELAQRALASFAKWQKGESAGRSLWYELLWNRQEELNHLGEAERRLIGLEQEEEKKLGQAQRDAEKKEADEERAMVERLAQHRRNHEANVRQQVATIGAKRAEIDAAAELRAERLARTAGWRVIRSKLEELLGSAVAEATPDDSSPIETLRSSVSGLEGQAGTLRRLWKGMTLQSIAYLVVGLAGAAVFVHPAFRGGLTDLLALVGSVGGLLASASASLSRFTGRLTDVQSEFDERVATTRMEGDAAMADWRTKRVADDVTPLDTRLSNEKTGFEEAHSLDRVSEEREIEKLRISHEKALQIMQADFAGRIGEAKREVEERTQRVGAVAQGRSLHDLVRARVQSRIYQQHLGVVHQVQEDLLELTDALMPSGGSIDARLFPRGTPRVVLIIDDLDRCPPDDVVKVLEAVQLLVKTRLFVVIIAMDIRYVTRALEKKYEGILTADGDPSGLDYIEKIVQIPYRVRPIAPESMAGYLHSQMEVSAPHGSEGTPDSRSDAGHTPGTQSQAEITPPRDGARRNKALPPEIQRFEPAELECVSRCALAVDITPRSTKRLVNVFKLMKNIWYRRGMEQPEMPVKGALILLLSLSAACAEPMRRILIECERQLQRPSSGTSQKLRTVLNRIIDEWSDASTRPADWETVRATVQDKSLLSDAVKLQDVGRANIELVRSFSFVGELEHPRTVAKQEVSVEVRGPVEVSGLGE